MGLRLFFLTIFPGAMFIQGATFIPNSRVGILHHKQAKLPENLQHSVDGA